MVNRQVRHELVSHPAPPAETGAPWGAALSHGWAQRRTRGGDAIKADGCLSATAVERHRPVVTAAVHGAGGQDILPPLIVNGSCESRAALLVGPVQLEEHRPVKNTGKVTVNPREGLPFVLCAGNEGTSLPGKNIAVTVSSQHPPFPARSSTFYGQHGRGRTSFFRMKRSVVSTSSSRVVL